MNETTATTSTTARILVVEDDACTALLFKMILEKAGYFIQHCADGETALHTLSRERFDAVVLDLMMPRVDGIQVLKRMRALPDHALTPVIVITAARLQVAEDEAFRYGARLYLEKTQHEELLAGLREVMAERSAVGVTSLRMAPTTSIDDKKLPQAGRATPDPKPSESSEAVKGLARFFRRTSAPE